MRQPKHERIPRDEESAADEHNVFCNVYDILPRVNALTRCLLCSEWGIYHTGVQVHGLEISFGGHGDDSTGVFCARPRSAQGAVFREQVGVGRADLDPVELRQAIAEVSKRWSGNSYDPFERNCNHFSDSLCRELTGKPAPQYANRFTKSAAVRAIFYRCLMPLGRCLERFLPPIESVGYAPDDVGGADDGGSALGIHGARGINQVLVEAATLQKAKANQLFASGAHGDAREAYRKALGYLSTMSRRSEEDEGALRQASEVRLALLLNLAACDLKTQDHAQCVSTCEQVLAAQPDHQKALYRRGVALSHIGRLQEASGDLRRALELNGEDTANATARDIREQIGRVKQLLEKERQKDREMAKRMFGGVSGAAE